MTNIILLLVIFAVPLTEEARILGLFTIPSISHQVVYRALMKQLHSRGHEVVVITTDPIRDTNLTNYSEIDLSPSYELWKPGIANISDKGAKGAGVLSAFLDFIQLGLDLCELDLNLPDVKKFLKNSGCKFDVVILETIISPCFLVVPYKLGVPYIGITSAPPTISMQASVGNPSTPSYIPDSFLGYTDHLSFLQRMHSAVHYLVFRLLQHHWILPSHDASIRKIFKNISMPYIGDLYYNMSLLLANYHFTFYYPRPNVPNMIEIGGLHLSAPGILPKDLEELMDSAPQGVIYFSLGTNVRSDKMPPETISIFLDVFSELPGFQVLWKWDAEEISGMPRNVKISKWFPQQDVLAHPKMKVFMYQGGLQSTEEAIRAQVPIIGIPFLADQETNVRKLELVGAGVRLNFKEISKDVIETALNKVINDPLYKKNMVKLSIITKDQPETPMERAVWWTEYVIRHKGALHLRSATAELTWYQYLLLDVISFVAVTSVIILWIMRRVIKCIHSVLVLLRSNKNKFE